MSATTEKPDTLLTALLAAQQEMPTLAKDAANEHFKNKYASVDAIMAAVLPVLNRHGLVWITLPGRDESGALTLGYRLVHAATGEAIDGTMPLLLGKQDSQGQGSAITYARRYSITSVLSLATGEDDDGERARQAAGNRRQAANGLAPQTPVPLSDERVNELVAAKKASGLTTDQVRSHLVAAGAADVPEGNVSLKTIRALTPQQAIGLMDVFTAAAEANAGASS
jgi:hypothetical protein